MMLVKFSDGSAELETFRSVANLSPEICIDLVSTIGAALMINNKLSRHNKDKMTVALTMLGLSYKMLESCGCSIVSEIKHNEWSGISKYETEGEI